MSRINTEISRPHQLLRRNRGLNPGRQGIVNTPNAPGLPLTNQPLANTSVGQQVNTFLHASGRLVSTVDQVTARQQHKLQQQMDKDLQELHRQGLLEGEVRHDFLSPESAKAFNSGVGARHGNQFAIDLPELIAKGQIKVNPGELASDAAQRIIQERVDGFDDDYSTAFTGSAFKSTATYLSQQIEQQRHETVTQGLADQTINAAKATSDQELQDTVAQIKHIGKLGGLTESQALMQGLQPAAQAAANAGEVEQTEKLIAAMGDHGKLIEASLLGHAANNQRALHNQEQSELKQKLMQVAEDFGPGSALAQLQEDENFAKLDPAQTQTLKIHLQQRQIDEYQESLLKMPPALALEQTQKPAPGIPKSVRQNMKQQLRARAQTQASEGINLWPTAEGKLNALDQTGDLFTSEQKKQIKQNILSEHRQSAIKDLLVDVTKQRLSPDDAMRTLLKASDLHEVDPDNPEAIDDAQFLATAPRVTKQAVENSRFMAEKELAAAALQADNGHPVPKDHSDAALAVMAQAPNASIAASFPEGQDGKPQLIDITNPELAAISASKMSLVPTALAERMRQRFDSAPNIEALLPSARLYATLAQTNPVLADKLQETLSDRGKMFVFAIDQALEENQPIVRNGQANEQWIEQLSNRLLPLIDREAISFDPKDVNMSLWESETIDAVVFETARKEFNAVLGPQDKASWLLWQGQALPRHIISKYIAETQKQYKAGALLQGQGAGDQAIMRAKQRAARIVSNQFQSIWWNGTVSIDDQSPLSLDQHTAGLLQTDLPDGVEVDDVTPRYVEGVNLTDGRVGAWMLYPNDGLNPITTGDGTPWLWREPLPQNATELEYRGAFKNFVDYYGVPGRVQLTRSGPAPNAVKKTFLKSPQSFSRSILTEWEKLSDKIKQQSTLERIRIPIQFDGLNGTLALDRSQIAQLKIIANHAPSNN